MRAPSCRCPCCRQCGACPGSHEGVAPSPCLAAHCVFPGLACRERRGVWDTSGLQGPALHLVGGDKDAANWLAKLAVVKSLLVDSGGCVPALFYLLHTACLARDPLGKAYPFRFRLPPAAVQPSRVGPVVLAPGPRARFTGVAGRPAKLALPGAAAMGALCTPAVHQQFASLSCLAPSAANMMRPDLDALAHAYIYMQVCGTRVGGAAAAAGWGRVLACLLARVGVDTANLAARGPPPLRHD